MLTAPLASARCRQGACLLSPGLPWRPVPALRATNTSEAQWCNALPFRAALPAKSPTWKPFLVPQPRGAHPARGNERGNPPAAQVPYCHCSAACQGCLSYGWAEGKVRALPSPWKPQGVLPIPAAASLTTLLRIRSSEQGQGRPGTAGADTVSPCPSLEQLLGLTGRGVSDF